MGYWDKLSPEERSAEMRRRQRKGAATKRAKRAKKYVCPSCSKKFANANKYANHVRYAHPKKTKGSMTHASDHRKDEVAALDSVERHVHYLYGKVETILEYYAHSNGVSFAAVAAGVAALLQHKR